MLLTYADRIRGDAARNKEVAIGCFKQALAQYDDQRFRLRHRSDVPQDKAAVAREAAQCTRGLVACCMTLGRTKDAIAATEHARGRTLAELANDADDLAPAEWVHARWAVHAAHRALEADDTPEHRDAAAEAEQAQERARAAVMEECPELELVRELSAQSYEELQSQLGANAVAAMWCLSDRWAGVFIMSQGLPEPRSLKYTESEVAHIVLTVSVFLAVTASGYAGGSESFDAALAAVANAVRMDDLYDLLRNGDATYHPPNYSDLVLLPHGILNAAPIDALPCEKHGNVTLPSAYNGACVYAPSIRMHTVARNRLPAAAPARAVSLLAVQNPTEDLTGADEEVEAIAGLASTHVPKILKHGDATKTALLTEIKGYEEAGEPYALHVASHGEHADRWSTALKLAGAHTPSEHLTVADIIALAVPGLRLCVASACETALNDSIYDSAAENVGIPSALLVAGACCCVAGLWRVDDAATALLMVHMWQLLNQGQSVAMALRNSQNWLRSLRQKAVREQLRSVAPGVEARWFSGVMRARGVLSSQRMETAIFHPDLTADSGGAGLTELTAKLRGLVPNACTRAGPGTKFTLADWWALAAAFEQSARSFRAMYTHLFPTGVDGMPERDIWFLYTPGVCNEPVLAIMHIHYLGSWEKCDPSQIAQVNIRFANDPPYFYESHPELQTGVMPTQFMFRVTSTETDASKSKDPTKWMGGRVNSAVDGPPEGTNQPPPWDWENDPERQDYAPTNIAKSPPERLPAAAGGGYRTIPLDYDCDAHRRFRVTHDLMKFAFEMLEPGIALELTPGTKAGGRLRDQMLAADEDSQPFASPYFWAGFVITGDGSVQCRLA